MAHAVGDAHEYEIYGAHFRVVFPIFDADGDLVTGAADLDSERSIDCDTFADCTNEAVEIATNSGMYRLDLTGFEMTAKVVAVIVKTSTAGAKTTPRVFYPRRLPIMESGTAQAGAAGTITLASVASAKSDFYKGLFVHCTNDVPAGVQYQGRRIISYNGTTKVATVESNWGTNPSSATTYDILIPETVGIPAFAGDVLTLSQLRIAAANANGGIYITNTSGHGIYSESTGGNGDGMRLIGEGAGRAATFAAGSTSGSSIFITASDTKIGISIAATVGSLSDGIKISAATDGIDVSSVDSVGIRGTLVGNITGDLSGSVGSVTGAVGSVTGAVGSVTGSVGSVVGSVGSVAGNVTGNVLGTVGNIGTGAIVASSFAAGAIDAAAIANGAIDAATFAAGAIDAAAIANGAIDAATFAAGAIDAAALAADVVNDIWMGTTLTEAYAADGAAATPAQLMYMLWAAVAEFAIVSTTLTAKKIDGSTTAMTFTLNDATQPTSRTRAT